METTTRLDEVRLAVPARLRLGGAGDSARLHWSIDDGWRQGEPVSDALAAFLRLANVNDPRVYLRFAERFGVLGIQADGRPGDPEASPGLPSTTVEGGARWHVEPLAAWRMYARHARAVVALGEALRRRVPALGPIDAARALQNLGLGGDDPWEALPSEMAPVGLRYATGRLVHNLERAGEQSLDVQRELLAHVVTTQWLARSHLTPRLAWGDTAPGLTLDVTSFMGQSQDDGPWSPFALYSVLAGQLVAAISNAGRYARCSACGEFYMPGDRRARLDRSRFCSTSCQLQGERKRKRESATRRRARERATG